MTKLSNLIMMRQDLCAADRVSSAFTSALSRRHLEHNRRREEHDLKSRWAPPNAARNRMHALELCLQNPRICLGDDFGMLVVNGRQAERSVGKSKRPC
jgi:hypothetical protein